MTAMGLGPSLRTTRQPHYGKAFLSETLLCDLTKWPTNVLHATQTWYSIKTVGFFKSATFVTCRDRFINKSGV